MSEEIKNNQIPEEIKDICRSCEENIHCQNKGCAFRSLGNEYCDYVLNATKLYLDLQKKVEQLEKEIDRLINLNKQLVEECQRLEDEKTRLNNIINELEEELDRGYKDLFDMKLVPGRELIINIKNYLNELKENK